MIWLAPCLYLCFSKWVAQVTNAAKKFGYPLWLDFLWTVRCTDAIGTDNFARAVYPDVSTRNLNVRAEPSSGKSRNVYLIII